MGGGAKSKNWLLCFIVISIEPKLDESFNLQLIFFLLCSPDPAY